MSTRRSTRTTVVTSTVNPSTEVTIDFALLRDDDFEKRPKTDYTYSRSATYSSKYVDGQVISPNLSRRRLYTDEMLRDQQASSSLLKQQQQKASTGMKTASSHVRVYGGRSTRSSLLAANNQSSYNSTNFSSNNVNNNSTAAAEAAMNGSYVAANSSSYSRNALNSHSGNVANSYSRNDADSNNMQSRVRENVVQHTVYTTRNSNQTSNNTETNSTMHQQNNNNSEAIFSEDETDSSIMGRGSTTKRKTTRRAISRSRSPGRNVRGAGSTRKRSSKLQDDDSEYSLESAVGSGGSRKSASYALSTGLDSDTEENSLVRLTNQNTRYNSERQQAKFDTKDLVTERSSTIIDTVATGTPITAKLMGCVLFVYGCTCIFMNRVWYSFGHPVYATLQRYLLLDTWILSQAATRKCRGLLLGLLFLLLPILLLLGTACSLHALGFVNVKSCGPLTGVYYVSKPSDLNAPGIGANIKKTLTDLFTWSDTQQAKVHIPADIPRSEVNWESVIDARIADLRSTIDQNSNKVVSEQRQKNTELEAAVSTLNSDLIKVNTQLSSITTIISDLSNLKLKVAQLQADIGNIPDHSDAVSQLQRDIIRLQTKLGEVDLGDQQQHGEAGVLMYIINEINNLASITKYVLGVSDEQPKLKSSVTNSQQTPTPAPIPIPCPGSSCVCESNLALRLRNLHEKIMAEFESKGGSGGTTLFVSSENSTGISEQMVRKMIQDELDIFAEDHTGMPDFALQSMGGQIVSTRSSETYYQEHGIMTFLGLPLYHLYKDPHVVIQPGVIPGECWCFHGQAGTLVVEMADNVKFNSFSIEHISAKQSVTGEISSAPKELEIYGLNSELDTNGQKLGGGVYDNKGSRLQFFPVEDTSLPAFPLVELRVLSNHGKEEFTCLYRFRVHGKLAPK